MKTLNNNITESYCSFEVSKLLKEKGFDCPCDTKVAFTNKKEFYVDKLANKIQLSDKELLLKYRTFNILCPTHALAIEWIRVNFGYWITIYVVRRDTVLEGTIYSYSPTIKKVPDELKQGLVVDYFPYQLFNSPQEATEAALMYTLQNLIK